MCSSLFNLRCEATNQLKDNFQPLCGKTHTCKCGKAIDSHSHALTCELIKIELTENKLNTINNMKYSDMYGSEDQQYSIIKIFQRILQIQASTVPSTTGLTRPNISGPS